METLFSGTLKIFLYDDYVTFNGSLGIAPRETVNVKYSDISSIGYGMSESAVEGNFLKVNVCGYVYMFTTSPCGDKENQKICDAILDKMKVINQTSTDYSNSSANNNIKNTSDNKALELKYQRALVLIKKLSFNNAVVVLKELGDYKNSKQLLSECEKHL